MATRYAFKYAILRRVYGTPFFLINGVTEDDLGGESKEVDWRRVLLPLLKRGRRGDLNVGSAELSVQEEGGEKQEEVLEKESEEGEHGTGKLSMMRREGEGVRKSVEGGRRRGLGSLVF